MKLHLTISVTEKLGHSLKRALSRPDRDDSSCTSSSQFKQFTIDYGQARSQDLEKGGGYFERVRSVQTTLTRIFIDLESVSDGLSEN